MYFNRVKSKGKAKSILKTIFQYSNILGLLGIIVAILLFYFAEKRKELTLSVDSFISLVDMTTLNSSDIKVSFDSVAVDNLYKVNCSLINSGNTAVTSNDIINNINVLFDPSATLLKYNIDMYPKTIKAYDRSSKNSILLKPDLLNPGDKITLTTYYTVNKLSALPSTNSRIVDGNILTVNKLVDIEKKTKFILPLGSKIENKLFWITFVWNILFFLLITWAFFFQKSQRESGLIVNFIGFIILGSGCMLTIMYLIANELK
jgi:hypothetical protein